MFKIGTTAIEQGSKGRGTLIICETIEVCEMIAKKLKKTFCPVNIKLYTVNNKNQQIIIEKITSGDISIATNLVGRGTDMKKVEICILFPLVVLRDKVKKIGTGQMIININNLVGYENIRCQEVKIQREFNRMKQNQSEQKIYFLKNFVIYQNTQEKILDKKNFLDGWMYVKSFFTDIIPI